VERSTRLDLSVPANAECTWRTPRVVSSLSSLSKAVLRRDLPSRSGSDQEEAKYVRIKRCPLLRKEASREIRAPERSTMVVG
jgi:hypothetical protein